MTPTTPTIRFTAYVNLHGSSMDETTLEIAQPPADKMIPIVSAELGIDGAPESVELYKYEGSYYSNLFAYTLNQPSFITLQDKLGAHLQFDIAQLQSVGLYPDMALMDMPSTVCNFLSSKCLFYREQILFPTDPLYLLVSEIELDEREKAVALTITADYPMYEGQTVIKGFPINQLDQAKAFAEQEYSRICNARPKERIHHFDLVGFVELNQPWDEYQPIFDSAYSKAAAGKFIHVE